VKILAVILYWATVIYACVLCSRLHSMAGLGLGAAAILLRIPLAGRRAVVSFWDVMVLVATSIWPYSVIALAWNAYVGVPREAVPWENPELASGLLLGFFVLLVAWCVWRDWRILRAQ
jgi:hypothetical protein